MPRVIRNPVVAARRRQVLPDWVRRMDAAANRRVNARAAHPAIDRGSVRLSTFANRGTLWFTIAAALVVLGKRRGTVRGIVSLTVASMLANLVGKRIFGGDRPLLKDTPLGRQLRNTPTSPSFPSGHSASAAAFATGVALEHPRVGAAIIPAALAVGYTRLHTGAHWLSDVIGGLALGATVAVVGRMLVPARAAGRTPRVGGVDITLPATADGDGVLLIVNPTSGDGTDPVAMLSERLPSALVRVLEPHLDIAELVAETVASDGAIRVLGVCGGDGTVATVAHLARRHGLPLLVLPGGTFNHFASTAGIDSFDVAIDALRDGRGVRADVAELRPVDGEPVTVLNAVSLGAYPRFVETREHYEPRFGKWAAGVVAAVLVLRSRPAVHVTIDGEGSRVWSLFVGVNENRATTIAPMQRLRLDDGVLDVRVLRGDSRARAMSSLAAGDRIRRILHLVRPNRSLVERFVTPAIAISVGSAEQSLLAADGEVLTGVRSATIAVVPAGIDVYAPPMARPALLQRPAA